MAEIKLTDAEKTAINGHTLTLRRNRVTPSPSGEMTSVGFQIAAVRAALLRTTGDDQLSIRLMLYKLLFLSSSEDRSKFVVTGRFPIPATPVWEAIRGMGLAYHDQHGYETGHLMNNQAEQVAIYSGMLSYSNYPFVIRRDTLVSVGNTIRSQLQKINAGARGVTCSKCGIRKVVNAPCEVCGFTPRNALTSSGKERA